MNTKHLSYAVMLADTLNFSLTAQKLGISQPALSKHILHLEQELGIKLFDRTAVPISLTPAGEHFIKEAKNLLYREEQLIRSIEEYKSGKCGQLDIGISPFRGQYLLSDTIKKFKEKYPKVKIVLHENTSNILRKEAAEGKYDFAIVNLSVDETQLDILPIEPDSLVLAVPKEMAQTLVFEKTNSLPVIDFKDCSTLPFVVVSHTQELRRLFDKLCLAANFSPFVSMEVVGISTAWAMTKLGIGASIVPLQFIKNEINCENTVLFSLKNCIYTRQPAVVTKKGQYLSEYANYAIKLLTKGY